MVISLQVSAQDWFSKNELGSQVDGYIIGIAGDTIYGSVEYSFPVSMQKRVLFTDSQNKTPTEYTPDDIRGFGIHAMNWHSTNIRMDTYEGPYIFKRFGILHSSQGPVGIYRVFDEADKHIKRLNSEEAEKDFKKITLKQPEGKFDNLYIRKGDEPGELIAGRSLKKKFIKRMQHYVGDNADLYRKITDKSLQHPDIFEIVAEYNAWFINRYRNQ